MQQKTSGSVSPHPQSIRIMWNKRQRNIFKHFFALNRMISVCAMWGWSLFLPCYSALPQKDATCEHYNSNKNWKVKGYKNYSSHFVNNNEWKWKESCIYFSGAGKLWGSPIKLPSSGNKNWEDFLAVITSPCYHFYKDVFMFCHISL